MYRNQILSNPAELGRLYKGNDDKLLTPIETTPHLIISSSQHSNLKSQRQKTRRRETGKRETESRKDGEMLRRRDMETGNRRNRRKSTLSKRCLSDN